MIKKIDITLFKKAEEVLRIQVPSYKIEAEIIDFHDLPPLKDNVDSLQLSGETFYGYYIYEELCGAISFKVEEGVVDIHRLMVHPNHFRKGIGKALLDFIEKHEENARTVIVSTGTKNTPAITFYQKCGYTITRETNVTEHLSITSFKKKLN